MNFIKTFILCAACTVASVAAAQQYTEMIDRGAVAMLKGRSTMQIMWRSFPTDVADLTFDVYRNGKKINAAPISDVTYYADTKGKVSYQYQVKAMLGDVEVETFDVTPWEATKRIHLSRPDGGTTPDGEEYTYSPNDCSVGDVDGDGQYELIVKWDPSNAHDNSHSGYTGNVFIDCYEFDGTQLWRIDLGKNIRAGAHYTQFMVYDFDGDGKAEMMCKTAPGSVDGTGAFVNQAATLDEIKNADNSKDFRTSAGRINGGQEYLTVFEGPTGKALHTVFYNPNRNAKLGGDAAGTFNWDDRSGRTDNGSYGNRGERHLAAVAHLAGRDKAASGVFVRGYYTYAFVWAVDWDGTELSTRWLHSSRTTSKYTVTDASGKETEYTPGKPTSGGGPATAYGQGNHNLSVADVDDDGCDEIIWGSCAFNNDGTLLYSTGLGHGDAIHVGKMIPSRKGLQVYQVHEAAPYGWDIHDAATGEIIFRDTATGDTGRGLAADISATNPGWEMWCSSAAMPRSCTDNKVLSSATPSVNFRVYWDGDVQDELLNGTKIDKYADAKISNLVSLLGSSCNGSKATPNLVADLVGDWREEVILWDSSTSSDLLVYTSQIEPEAKRPCLMTDPQYRMAICWQNVAYNQPPHVGYSFADGFEYPLVSGIASVGADNRADTVAAYTVGGVKVADSELENLAPGVYVLQDANGNARKYIKK